MYNLCTSSLYLCVTTASGNREYDRLLEYSDTLITQLAAALCSGTLAQKLRAKKLITSDLYDSATNAGQGITEKTRIRPIIQYVMTQTKENREIFHKFLTVLRDIEGLGDLVKCLEGMKLNCDKTFHSNYIVPVAVYTSKTAAYALTANYVPTTLIGS